MKILLDECVPKRLKAHLQEYEVYTVRELGLGGLKNGKLMAYCVENKFDVLLTIDKNMAFQQNMANYPIAIAVLNSKSSKLEVLLSFLPAFRARLVNIKKHAYYTIDK